MYLFAGDNATHEPQGNEARIWGPPGCGKTTYLARQIANAAAKYGSEGVMVTSFTRAAAAELVGRDLPIRQDGTGTLHAHCYHALGCPPIAEVHIDQWNREHPGYRLSPRDQTVDEMFSETPLIRGIGDELYNQQQIQRARVVPVELWPSRLRVFHERWAGWKRANGFSDFTDLLEIALRDLHTAPGGPAVIFVDEAQDLTPLQLQLLREWARRVEFLVMAGDDDQTIYGFAGAAPEVLLKHVIPERFRHVLTQSFRVPRAIHALSQSWIQRVAVREPKEYRPRDTDGELRLLHRGNYRHPEAILDDAQRYVDQGKTVMVLATCSYMLEPAKAVLRKRGLPFHNPYRRKRGDWNPLYRPDRLGERSHRALTAADRLVAFLRPHALTGGESWRIENLHAWIDWLKQGSLLVPGASSALRLWPATEGASLGDVLQPAAFEQLIVAMRQETLDGALAWFLDNLKPPRRRAAQYPVRVVQRGGPSALRDTPRIIVGTGHSVKGGEADVVYLLPDLSASGTRNWEGRRADHDAVARLGYVMMTRARESLIICDPAGSEYMPIAPVAARLLSGGKG